MAKAETAGGWERSARTADVLLWLWRLLASAQFAVSLTAFLAVAGLLAVVLPQVPNAMRSNPVVVDLWLEGQRGNFGPFTELMHRLGLFTVVDTWWFLTGLGLLGVSVSVYVADRFLLAWRNIVRPRAVVPDSFFERAANREALATPAGGVAALEAALRRRRFQVRSVAQAGATYAFADRYAWAQLGTFLSHGALLLFLVGAVVSRTGGYSNSLLIAEGTTSPVFAVSHPEQMQIEVVDAVGRFEGGEPRDYRTQLVIYQGGEEVARGVATVNDPLEYGGYRFHQSAYLGEGAALAVRDASTGNARYEEVLALDELAPAPSIEVRDGSGKLLLDDVIVPTDFLGDARGTLITVPGTDRSYWVGVTPGEDDEWRLAVFAPESEEASLVAAAGETREGDGLRWTFRGVDGLPSVVTQGIPGDSDRALVLLSQTPEGEPYLTVLGPVDGRALTLYADQPVRIGESEYEFEGRREFAGIDVRKDPGANFIWVAAGLLLAGLMITFYVPRLRLWARVRGDETVLAAPAERAALFHSETKRIERELEAAQGIRDA
jgi:cytochrome c biogenesis protein ResB